MKCILCSYGLPIEVIAGKALHFVERESPKRWECQDQPGAKLDLFSKIDRLSEEDSDYLTWEGEGGRVQ